MNPRDPFGAYTISNRARSAGLRDSSTTLFNFGISMTPLALAYHYTDISTFFPKSVPKNPHMPLRKSKISKKKFQDFCRITLDNLKNA